MKETSSGVSRRDFVTTGMIGAGALLAGMVDASTTPDSSLGLGTGGTLVVARRHGTINEMVNQCVERLGGIERFVPAGSRVAIKVCGSSNSIPSNTSPEVVEQVIRLVKTAEPDKITVYDHVFIGQSPWICFQRIASKTESAGGEAVELHEDVNDYTATELPGVGMKSTHIPKVLDEADVLINVPLLKHWGTGLKSHVGSVLYRRDEPNIPDPRNTPHGCTGGVPQGIADINTCPAIRNKQSLTIVDAIRPAVDGNHGAAVCADYNGIVAGTDPVATEHICLEIARRYNPTPHYYLTESIPKAAALGLGTDDPTQITLDERSLVQIPELELPLTIVGMASMAALAYSSARSRNRRAGREP